MVTGLSTKVSISKSADDTTDRVCGSVGGGGWDGGGGDPVVQEPPLPWAINRRSFMWRFNFNRGNIFERQLVHRNGPPLPPCACRWGPWWDIADWGRLQGGGGRTCANKQHFWSSKNDFLCRPGGKLGERHFRQEEWELTLPLQRGGRGECLPSSWWWVPCISSGVSGVTCISKSMPAVLNRI